MKTLTDLTAPVTPVRKLLEKDVQKQCVDWARARGYWARKFSSQSQRSVPDYLFAKQEYRCNSIDCYPPPAEHTYVAVGDEMKFACEFKAPGKTSTEAQIEEQEAMRAAGWIVFECDNFEDFKTRVDLLEQEHGVNSI